MAQRGIFKTSLGGEIPVYKVAFTKAEYDPYRHTDCLYAFPQSGHSPPLLPEPFRTEFRMIIEDVYSRYNNTAFYEYEGTGYLLNSDMSNNVESMFTATTGTTETDESGIIYSEYIRGSVNPNWLPSTSPNLSYRRPIPTSYYDVSTTITSPVALIMDADNKLYRFTFETYFNAIGIQGTYTTGFLNTPLGANFDASVLYYEERVDYGDTVSPEPTQPIERFNPRITTNTIGLYRANKDELRKFIHDVWETTLLESINSYFVGDGSDALLGITWYYGLRNIAPISDTITYITLGNVAYINSGLFNVLRHEFVTYDFGSVKVPASYGDYRDYTLCKYSVYLPFVGEFVDLNADDVVGKDLYLKYTINMTDGSAMCYLSTDNDVVNTKGLLFSSPCTWGYDIPFKADSVKSAGNFAIGLAGAVVGAVTKMPIGDVSNMSGRSYSTGSGSGNDGIIGDLVPKLIVYKQTDLSGSDFVTASGRPSTETVTIGGCTGYLQVSNVYNAGTLPFRGSDEIIAMLKEGIYI